MFQKRLANEPTQPLLGGRVGVDTAPLELRDGRKLCARDTCIYTCSSVQPYRDGCYSSCEVFTETRHALQLYASTITMAIRFSKVFTEIEALPYRSGWITWYVNRRTELPPFRLLGHRGVNTSVCCIRFTKDQSNAV